MASRALRRRIHHGDANGLNHEHSDRSESDALSEPLLENYRHDENYSEAYVHEHHQDIWEQQRRVRLHWTHLFSQLIAQWAQWFANIIIVSGSLLGRFLPLPFTTNTGQDWKNTPLSLSPLQEFFQHVVRIGLLFTAEIVGNHTQSLLRDGVLLPPDGMLWPLTTTICVIIVYFQQERLRNLQQRLEIPFDGTRLDHQDSLRQLWKLAYPNRDLPSLKSELWKEMGWQGPDPSTDFRGGGFISLENLIFFAKNYPDSFQRLLHKQDGKRAEWEYPFAVAGINISFMLVQMLDLQSGRPTSVAGNRFLELLGEDEMAFDNLFCVAFQMMDAQWLAKRASYMEFNDVLKSTRSQLERELALEDLSSIKDLPAYNLLNI